MSRWNLLVILVVVLIGRGVNAQPPVPVISGGVGFTNSTVGGSTFLQPIIVPVIAAPLGSHFLVESRG